MSQCTTATITTPNSSAFVTSSSLKIMDRMSKNDKNGDRMPKRDKAESSRTPKSDSIENKTHKNEPNLDVVPGNELTGSNRMPKLYYHNRIKRAASNGPNGMPNEKVPFADLDKMPNCSSEYQHHGTLSSEFYVSMASPMPSLAPSSSSSSSVVASSDSFSTIRRNCERHMRRLERYKKARSFCSLDTAEAEEEAENEEDNKIGNNAKPTPTAEGGNDQNKTDDQQRQEKQILRQTADEKTGTGGEQFETLRSKMLSLMENDMHLLAKLLQLGETLCELRSKHEQQQQQQQQQQHQNPMKYCDDYGEGGGQTASISSPNWAQQTAAEHDDSDGDVHDDEDEQQHKQKNALDDEEADVVGDASAPRSLLHRARQHRRRAPLPPEFGRASAASVTRVYLAGEQQTNDANRRRGVPLGGAVRSDQEENDEEGEEDDDQISPNVQYFSRKNSVLRIPIPPRASNRNFGRPKFHQRLNSSNFSSSSPSCCAAAAAGSSPCVMMATHTKMPSSVAPSPSAHCAAAANNASAAHHHHNGTAPPPPPPSTIVETDLLMLDSGHSSASSEADPQQHSPPGAPSSRFSTFSSSLSTGSASCRSLFGVVALAAAADAAKRTKSEERRADGSRGGSAAERCAGVAETDRAVLDEWKTNCNVKNNKSSFSD
ncbi:hypothetical protein niasHT_018489 [Heterodera trifolii]|uniref:Uncharacterized protein n=1 Tax=Heterodera trifolii TaxID=157864 RepID=A0ABD2KU17_9BILA